MPNDSFNFNAFMQESKDCLIRPKEYFATMKTSGGLQEPVIKALIYGAVSGIISFVFNLLHWGMASGGMFGGSVGVMILIWSVIGAVIGLFIGAVVMLVVSAICKGSTDFESNARVTAALMVLMPIRSAFAFVYKINFSLAIVVGAIISLYGVYLMYHALVQSLKAGEKPSRIVSIILAGLLVIFIIAGMAAKRAASGFIKNMDENGVYSNEFKKYQKELEKSAKEFEKAAKDLKEDMEEDAEGDSEEIADSTSE